MQYGSTDPEDNCQYLSNDLSFQQDEHEIYLQSPSRRKSGFLVYFVAILAVFGAGFALFQNKDALISVYQDNIYFKKSTGSSGTTLSDSTSSTANGDAFDSIGSLTFKLARVGYEPISIDSVVVNYKFLSIMNTIVEPYTANQLWVPGMQDSLYYKYAVCSDISGQCSLGTMSMDNSLVENVYIECSPFDRFTVTVEEYYTDGDTYSQSAVGGAVCMYIRREIRTLSEVDLTALMDAMYTMWSTSDEDGQEMYGDDFHSNSYLVNFHHFNAAWQDSDHIHEGNGFLMQHIKMTNTFEKSIQSIDPSVSVPYWDFTIDDASGKGAHNSAVMTSLIFGSMTQPTDLTYGFTWDDDLIVDAAIPDGRWAYLKSDINENYDDLRSGYGYLRAPWNMNPSPYVSRFTMDLQIGISLPTCTQHYDVLQEDDMMDFFYNIQYDPHATAHSLSGGIYGCDKLIPLLDAGYITDETDLKTICSKWVFYLKEFYRYNYLTPKSNCTVNDDVQTSNCGFECVENMKEALQANLELKIDSNVPSTMGEDGWDAWYDFICTGDGANIFSGDHLESASPADPSFWVIHPTLERLLHVKFMAGGFDDETWADDAENEDVCDKAYCYNSDYGGFGYYDDCCYGHFSDSQMFDAVSGNRSAHCGETNNDILLATDPRSMMYSMPYIYDTFSWSHCGEDYWSLIETMAAPSF